MLVRFDMNLEIPIQIFKKPTLRATIQVPAEAVNAPVIDTEIADNSGQCTGGHSASYRHAGENNH